MQKGVIEEGKNVLKDNNNLPEMKRRKRKVVEEYQISKVSFRSLLELYIRDCKRRNLSEVTIKGYMYNAKYFFNFAGQDLLCSEVTQDLINEYYLYLQESHRASTVNTYVFNISPIIKYGYRNGYIDENIEFTHLVEQKEIKDIYTKEELEVLLKKPTNDDFCEFRAWVIVNVFLATGIRARELRNLKIENVKLDDGYIVLNQTKNKEPRVLPIPTTLHNVLNDWLRVRNGTKEDYLFCNIYGEQMQRSVLQTAIKRYSKKRGVDKYGLHLYRHTFITLSIRNGMSPLMLKRITGHKSMKMLERYYAFNPTDLVNIVDEFNPLEDFKPKERKEWKVKKGK